MARRTSLLAVLCAIALGFWGAATTGHALSASECMPWSKARPIIADQQLIGSEKATELAQASFAGEVLVNVKFCKEGNDFVYLVFLLRTDTNALRRVIVDAVTGAL